MYMYMYDVYIYILYTYKYMPYSVASARGLYLSVAQQYGF